jgi:hypothetical protein
LASSRSAASGRASPVEAVPADVLTISARPSPASETGAFCGGLFLPATVLEKISLGRPGVDERIAR